MTNSRIAVDFFCVVTPWACTACGSDDMAAETRFCTRTCALSGSVPIAKVTVSV